MSYISYIYLTNITSLLCICFCGIKTEWRWAHESKQIQSERQKINSPKVIFPLSTVFLEEQSVSLSASNSFNKRHPNHCLSLELDSVQRISTGDSTRCAVPASIQVYTYLDMLHIDYQCKKWSVITPHLGS